MTKRQKSVISLAISLVIAGAMIISGRVVSDPGTASTIVLALIGVWFAPWWMLQGKDLSQRLRLACLGPRRGSDGAGD